MTIKRKAWVFAVVYTLLSLATEAGLMILIGLKIPQDNAIIAPIILTIPPVLAVWICGYRRPNEFVVLVVLTSVLTLIISIAVSTATGVSTGLIQPIIIRPISALLAAAITRRVVANSHTEPRGGSPSPTLPKRPAAS
jgi:hypothetical protein